MVPILRKHDQDRMCIYPRTLTWDSNSGGKQGVNPGAQQTRSGCPCPTLISLEDPQSHHCLYCDSVVVQKVTKLFNHRL